MQTFAVAARIACRRKDRVNVRECVAGGVVAEREAVA